MATTAEQLILRGLHLIVRASFSPNDPSSQAKHFMGLQNDLGPWLKDYADEIAKPAEDMLFSQQQETVDADGNGGIQQ